MADVGCKVSDFKKIKSLITCWLSKCWFSRVNMTYFPPYLPPGAHSVDGRWAGVHICRLRRLHEWICSLLLGELAPVLSSTPKSCSSSAFNVPDQWCPRWWLNLHFLTTWFSSKQNGTSHSCPGEGTKESLNLTEQLASPSHDHRKSHHFLAECRKLFPWVRGAASTSFPKEYAVTVLKKHILLLGENQLNFIQLIQPMFIDNQCVTLLGANY